MSTIINATTTNGVVIQPDNSGSLVLQTNSGTTALTIDTSQNVGIGTTSPTNYANQRTLAVNGTNYGRLDLMAGGTVYGTLYGGTAGPTLASSGALPVMFETNGSERMRIDSSGNVLVGTTSQVAQGKFNIVYQNSSTQGLNFNENSGSGLTRDCIRFQTSGTQVGGISVSTTATAYNTSSDYRLKENILPMTGALDKVALLKPVTYTWKIDGSDGQGFIAHELQEVVPDCVSGEKDAVDEKGNPIHQGVDTSFLVATLTAAIQEQQTIINDLKARIETLEAK